MDLGSIFKEFSFFFYKETFYKNQTLKSKIQPSYLIYFNNMFVASPVPTSLQSVLQAQSLL